MNKYIQGKIANKETKSGIGQNNKPYKLTIFTVEDFQGNSTKFSTFNNDIAEAWSVGDLVKAEYKTEGQYNQLIGFDLLSEVPDLDNSKSNVGVSVVGMKDRLIVRQNVLHRATDLAINTKTLEKDELIDYIFSTAEKLEEWVFRETKKDNDN